MIQKSGASRKSGRGKENIKVATTLKTHVTHDGSPVTGANVHLDERQSGLQPIPPDDDTDGNGDAYHTGCKSGYYDIVVTHSVYGEVIIDRTYIGGGGTVTKNCPM